MHHNVIVGQSGGPTAAINASLAGVYETARALTSGKVYGMLHGLEGLLHGRCIDLASVLPTQNEIELLKRTPASFLGSCRFKLPEMGMDDAVYAQLFDALEKLEIGYFIYIGGNDSMDTIQKLSVYGKAKGSAIRFMGVPKTVDNDLPCTDHTPGYGSAAKYIAATLKEIVRDSSVYYLESVTFVEIMGRNAGWLTGAAALAKSDDCEGVDFICLPESVFDQAAFTARVKEKLTHKRALVVAVSEGVKLADGRYLCEIAAQSAAVDAFGHRMLTGTAAYLASSLHNALGCKTRAIELNTPQRAAAHLASATDLHEAYKVGAAAVRGAFDGRTGEMSVLVRTGDAPYACTTDFADIANIANREKTVPAAWIDAQEYTVNDAFLAYVRPLIQGEVTQTYKDGLPQHIYYHA